MHLEEALYRYFGYTEFRPLQAEICMSILEGHDTFALLPTGAGKSICFQLPSLLLPGLTVVISPLIALMQDQVDTLIRKGVLATYISSTLSSDEVESRIELLKLNRYKLLYISPERLQNEVLQSVLLSCPISLLVIDEAHCISMWGHDFRPSYLSIAKTLKMLQLRPPIAAFTATATPATIADISTQLALENPHFFKQSFERTNLSISITTVRAQQQQENLLLLLLQKHQGQSGIVYVATRDAAEMLSRLCMHRFRELQNKVAFYHGALESQERQRIQKLFIAGHLSVIFATTAFGMGIDAPHIRFVIHFHYPSSIEGYYQEIGRAGRDGERASCYLLFNAENNAIHTQLLSHGRDRTQQQSALKKVKSMEQLAHTNHCLQHEILKYFSEKKHKKCQNCSNCKNIQVFTTKQLQRRNHLLRLRSVLQQENDCLHPSEVLSDNQVLQLCAYEDISESVIQRLTGFGNGWKQRWLKHCISQDGTI